MARRSGPAFLIVALLALAAPASAPAREPSAQSAVTEGFELVGHDPLYSRGMNAAPAVYDHYVYVGNRTDGSPDHPHPGVLVVDVANPSAPKVVGEIGPPEEGNVAETSRELRVWHEAGLLLVLNFGCSSIIHACRGGETRGSNIRFYDVRANPVDPPLVATYLPSRTPHEFFLWEDPRRPGRALLYMSTPTASTTQPNLIVTDISGARDKRFDEIVKWIGTDQFSAADRDRFDVRLHSMSVTADGSRTYLAFLGGGFLILDSTEVARGVDKAELHLVTQVQDRASWGDPGAHSSLKIPGRPFALVTDEVYGDFLDPITGQDHGCPWGWTRLIDIRDERRPSVVAEFKAPQNERSYCRTSEGSDPANTTWTSYAAHNPTLLPDLALITWHSSGLLAVSLTDPARPALLGSFSPTPLPMVATEDPALSLGRNKVVMWSYPIIVDGLIYVVDIRNGLYVLRYTGPGAEQVAEVSFLEGSSNLGDALRLESCGRGDATANHVLGTSGPDVLNGTTGPDVLCALLGNDRLRGSEGKDLLLAGPGRDRLGGGTGRDVLLGERGPDVLRGGRGPDILRGGPGKDRCIGGGGRDRLRSCEPRRT